jgi:hypothetical protein
MPCQSQFTEESYDPFIAIKYQNKEIIDELNNVTDFLCFTLKHLCEKDYSIVKDIFREKRNLQRWFDNHLHLDSERKLIEESKKLEEEILKQIKKTKK